MQLLLIQQLSFGPCQVVKRLRRIKDIIKQLFVVHYMMELSLLHVEARFTFHFIPLYKLYSDFSCELLQNELFDVVLFLPTSVLANILE